MKPDNEIRDAKFMAVFGFGVLGIWLTGLLAASLAGIPHGSIQPGQVAQNPAEVWGVNSHMQMFWTAAAITWAAVVSAVAAAWLIASRSPIGESDDPFLVSRRPAGGWRATNPWVVVGAVAMVAVAGAGTAILVSPMAGLVLALPLASGPVVGMLIRLRSSGQEEIPGDRIVLGAPKGDLKHWVACRPDMSAFLLGSPSSGKTGGVIIPNLLAWDGAAVSTSTKFDVLAETARRRLELGECWVWAPLDRDFQLPAGVHRLDYSPISGAESWAVASRHAHALAYSSGDGESSKVWASSAAQLIAVALHACALSGEGISKGVEAMKQPGWRWLRKVLEESKEANPAALTALASLEGRNQTFIADMSANIDQALSLAMSGQLVEHQGEHLDWAEFLSGRNALFIILPTELPHVDPAPWVNSLLADLVYAVRQASAANGYRLPHRLLMLLDELGALCSLDNLDSLIATQRAAGMSFLLAAQSLAQIDRRYGQAGSRTIRDAVGAIVLGMGVSDDQALRDMEELVGGGVALQQRGGRKDDPKVVSDEAERWAKHEIAGLQQYHFYVHLKGSGKPRHVRAPFFMDSPFCDLWEGTAPVKAEEAPPAAEAEGVSEGDDGALDLGGLYRVAERAGRSIGRVPALDRAANWWVGKAEDVWTRISAPGLQLQIATAAEVLQARTKGIEIGHHGQGVNVSGLSTWRPIMPSSAPRRHDIQVVGEDGEISRFEPSEGLHSRYQAQAPHYAKSFTSGEANSTPNGDDEGLAGSDRTLEGPSGGFEAQIEPKRPSGTLGPSGLVRREEHKNGNWNGAKPGDGNREKRAAVEVWQGDEAGADGGSVEAVGPPARWSKKHFDASRVWTLMRRFGARRDARLRADREAMGARVRAEPARLIEADEPDTDDIFTPSGRAADPGLATAPQPAAPADLEASPPLVRMAPPAERPNGLKGKCVVCGRQVLPREGLMSRRVDRWIVRHPDCQLPG